MGYSRKQFLVKAAGLVSLPFIGSTLSRADVSKLLQDGDLPEWRFTELSEAIKFPVLLRSIELLKAQGEYILVVTSQEGIKGITQCNDRVKHLTSILKGLVIPHFIDKDARQLPQLVDNAYRLNSNYKYAGMPLWNCIGSVEIAIWDLLGKVSQKPVHALLGKQIRTEYGVYISDWNREGDPEKISDVLLSKLAVTGAKGVKIKIGGRMVNTPENDAYTKRYIPVLRKRLGDDVTIYADANGSFTAKEGVAAGRLLEDYGVEIFEEPCNFEDEEGMSQVTQALEKVKLAGGEQDSILYRFRRLARNNVYDILQPDVYYNGGILRTLQVAEIARVYGSKGIAPHTPKADPLIAPFWQLAALIPNLTGLQECVYNPDQAVPQWHSEIKIVDGKMTIPVRVGLGVEFDSDIWKSAEKVLAFG